MKKYNVIIINGCTGSQIEMDLDNIKQVEREIQEYKNDLSYTISVYDNEFKDFIYYKWCNEMMAEINIIMSRVRDLRTTTRKIK